MSTFQERFHEAMVDGFRENAANYNETTDLYSLGAPDTVDDFFDYLESEFSGDLSQGERQQIRYVNQAWAWAWAQYEREQQEEQEAEEAFQSNFDSKPHPFAWRDNILPIQRLFLKLMYVVGLGGFAYGMYVTTQLKNAKVGGFYTGLGMFIAVQMHWGIQGFFNWLEKRDSKLLEKPLSNENLAPSLSS